jgi:CHAD domain-containing protein
MILRMPTRSSAAKTKKNRSPAPHSAHVGVPELLLLPIDQVLRLCEPPPERAKDVHALRVSIRRLRARISAFRSLVGSARRKSLDDGLAWLSDQLSPVREWDVIIADLPERPSKRRRQEDLRKAAVQKRDKALQSLHEALDDKKGRRLKRGLLALRRALSRDEPPAANDERELRARSREAVARRLRKFRERYREVSEEQRDADALHRLRLETKKLRYTLEVLQQACPGAAVERPLETLVGLQDRLGAEQDAVVERHRLERLSKSIRMPRRKAVAAPPVDAQAIDGACRRAMRQIQGIRISD